GRTPSGTLASSRAPLRALRTANVTSASPAPLRGSGLKGGLTRHHSLALRLWLDPPTASPRRPPSPTTRRQTALVSPTQSGGLRSRPRPPTRSRRARSRRTAVALVRTRPWNRQSL